MPLLVAALAEEIQIPFASDILVASEYLSTVRTVYFPFHHTAKLWQKILITKYFQ